MRINHRGEELADRYQPPPVTMPVAIELAENITAIEQGRSTLDERTRRRLVLR